MDPVIALIALGLLVLVIAGYLIAHRKKRLKVRDGLLRFDSKGRSKPPFRKGGR